jgi:hypothetical protein
MSMQLKTHVSAAEDTCSALVYVYAAEDTCSMSMQLKTQALR